MPSLPRIITVDPIGNIARVVHAAIDISEYACRQIDVPSGAEALEEIEIGKANLVICSSHLDDMTAFDFIEQAKKVIENPAIVVLANENDPEIDIQDQREGGYLYLRRPVDATIFSQVLFAGMRGDDIFNALRSPSSGGGGGSTDYGPVPSLDLEKAKDIIDGLIMDLGAMAILFIGRTGDVLLERGTANYIERDSLLQALLPGMIANIDMKNIVGGDATTLQFYDGDHRDVYTLSVGLHHMLCIAYDGEKGQREFGAVNRFGRKAAMDLIPLIGPEAFFIRRVQSEAPEEDDVPRKRATSTMAVIQPEEDDVIQLERAAELSHSGGNDLEELAMDAIDDDLFDASFLDQLDSLNLDEANNLFDIENLEGLEVNVKSRSTLSDEEARQLGILGD